MLVYLLSIPSAVIVPHHDIVASNRFSFLQKVKFLRPQTSHIIIIGPDHFSQFQGSVRYANNYPSFDKELFLNINFPLTLDNGIVNSDHSINNILPDIDKLWPQAKFLPIIIGQKFDPIKLDPLINQISSTCKFDCLIITSIDFSHYLPATMANAHDSYTLDALYNQNLDKIISSEVDSPQSLYFVAKYSFDKNKSFNLFDHTNSGFLLNSSDGEVTTHIFGLFNKSLFPKKSFVKTKLDLPYSIDQKNNINSLGERFFYGFDEININSTLADFAIITTTFDNKVTQSYFPITTQKNITNFVKGQEKINLIKKYFDSVNDLNITKNYFWGTLIYERNK